MNILITGAAGFVGKNLTAALECIRDGKDRTHPGLEIGRLYLYDIDSSADLLEEALCNASQLTSLRIGDFVAVELRELQKLAAREEGNIAVKGEFCEKEIFGFNIVF